MARQHPARLARVGGVQEDGRRRGARRHVEPHHLPEGDRRQHRLRRRHRGARRNGRVGRRRVLRAGDRGRPRGRRPDPVRLRRLGSSGRVRVVRAAAPHGQRRGGVDRGARRTSSGRIERPNIFIKIPGTAEGVPAIEETIAAGINVNVTLLFSLAPVRGHPHGLHLRASSGASPPISRSRTCTRSRASSSRVSTPRSTRSLPEGSPLRGKAAVANAKLAYQRFGEILASASDGRALAGEGATAQRTLWASTGTKNPEYSDVLYVDDLIGPDCVNTMPEGTIAAFEDHGTVTRTVDADVEGARAAIAALAGAGVSLDDVTHKLEVDGVKSFSDSFDSLIGTIRQSLDAQRAAVMATTAKRPAPNPLRAGLRVGGASEPTVFVIFGATGDLAQRKLLPAIYNLAVRGLLPDRFAVIGYARTEMDRRRSSRVRYARRSRATRGRRSTSTYWQAFAASSTTSRRLRRGRGLHARSASASRRSTPRMAPSGNRVFYLSTPASFFPVIVQRMGATKLNKPPGFARVVIEKPFGHDLTIVAGARRDRAPVVPEQPDLPHRSLPGQGDRPEHLRVPVRQRDLRAGVEQHLRRPRPDHRGRVDRRRAPRRVLRGDRRRPRHRAEPPAAGAGAGRDGAARDVRRRPDPRREGQSCCVRRRRR